MTLDLAMQKSLRVAGMCIGVCNYKHIGTLSNAVRDA